MKKVALGVLPLAAALNSCGGGGGGGGSPAPTPKPPVTSPAPSPLPTPAPTPTPTPAATITYLHTFGVSPTDGFQPNGPLLQASDGNFYGTTRNGGANTCRPVLPIPCGVVFRITPSGQETVLYTFGATPADGYTPSGSLIQGNDGALYGTTSNGGAHGGGGTIFRITLDGSYRTLHSFSGTNGEGYGVSRVIFGQDGNLYGITSSGGTNICPSIPVAGPNCGTIFRLTPDGVLTTLHSFGRTPTDGVLPTGSLLQSSDGSFYGLTHMGGAYNEGTVFRLSPDGSLTILHSFGATDLDPSSPQGSLVRGVDGALYGTTPAGGAGQKGTVFRVDAGGNVTVVYEFGKNGLIDGDGPAAHLTVGRDGNLYGTTRRGGVNYGGTVFRLDYTGKLTTLYSFGMGQLQPNDPETGVIEGQDGALYGVTFYNEGLGGVGNRFGFGAMYKLTLQ